MTEPVRVEPLRCGGCGALVALGQGRSARCPFCGVDTAIPEAHEALQRAARAFTEDRDVLANLYDRLGRPPSAITQALAHDIDGWLPRLAFGVFAAAIGPIGPPLVLLVALGLGVPVAALLRFGCWVLGLPVPHALSPYLVLAVATLLVLLFVAVPVIFLRMEHDLTDVRRDVHASLAAALPEREGGPSLCRHCGAALDVPKGALGVPCSYCRADNLVALPSAWVTRVRASEFNQFLKIDAALEAYRLASERATQAMWKLAFASLFVFPFAMAVAWLLSVMTIQF